MPTCPLWTRFFGISLLLLLICGSATAADLAASGQEPAIVPLLRLNNSYSTDHLYTIDPNEASALAPFVTLAAAGSTDPNVQALAYGSDGIAGYLYNRLRPALTAGVGGPIVAPPSPIPGTTAVYRLWNATIRAHVLTANTAERNTLLTQGYVYDADSDQVGSKDGILGYIRTTASPGTIAVYRLTNATLTDTIYTTSTAERSSLIAAGWLSKGLLGYAMASPTIPYYETSAPTGAYLNKAPRGVMLVIHGGGLTIVGQLQTRLRQPAVTRWTNRGWLVLNVDYRFGAIQSNGTLTSLADIDWFYDRTRAWQGNAKKICATGDSAGAYLSTMLATERPGLACAIPQAGVYDLPHLVDPTDPVPYLAPQVFTTFSTIVFAPYGGGSVDQAVTIMGALSPINRIAQTGTIPILFSNAPNDIIIAMSNPRSYCAARPTNSQLVVLRAPDPGTTGTPWIHSSVNTNDLINYYATEQTFSDAVLAGTWSSNCSVG